MEYAERAGLEDDVADAFVDIMRRVDRAYLDHLAAEEDKKNKRNQDSHGRGPTKRPKRSKSRVQYRKKR